MAYITIGHWKPYPSPEEKALIEAQVAVWVSQGKTDGTYHGVQNHEESSVTVVRTWVDLAAAQELVDWSNANGFVAPRWTCTIEQQS